MPFYEKEIEKCPVCGGENLVQETHQTSYKHLVLKTGSHCADCGVKIVFNVAKKEEK